ncbi:hypothetical protein HanPSC8_Chr01g0043911 [Helianthus annuus]|nr:hypothetical protein HanPSC8_Chr01g0043911 [Helianthus annuus]
MFQGDTPLQDQSQPQVQESQPFVKRHVSIIASIRIVYIGFIGIRASRLIDPGSKKENHSARLRARNDNLGLPIESEN